MLQNIKMLLELTDNSKDELILFYIKRITDIVLSYCSLSVLNSALESFIEDKICNIIKPSLNNSNKNTGKVKSVTRGDTRIEYNVSEGVMDTSKGSILTKADKEYLNSFKPNSWRLL